MRARIGHSALSAPRIALPFVPLCGTSPCGETHSFDNGDEAPVRTQIHRYQSAQDLGEKRMSKTVTKADIAKSICAQSDMKQQHAKKVLDAMLGIMKKALKEEKEMLLSGFGKFEAFTKKNRKGRNPQTGEEIVLESHDVLAFRISRKFKAAMNAEQ